MLVNDISSLDWEASRLWKAKTGLLNASYQVVMQVYIPEIMYIPGEDKLELALDAENLSYAWFSSSRMQKHIDERLAHLGLDATAIEAKVLKHCCSDIAQFDRLLASVETRRLRSVRALVEYRRTLRPYLTNGEGRSATQSEVAKSPRAAHVLAPVPEQIPQIGPAPLSKATAKKPEETQPDQLAAAMARLAPELVKPDRYKCQTVIRRENSVRHLKTGLSTRLLKDRFASRKKGGVR